MLRLMTCPFLKFKNIFFLKKLSMGDSRYGIAGTVKTAKNRIKPHCSSMQFQTGIGTASEQHITAVLIGIRTTGTAGIA